MGIRLLNKKLLLKAFHCGNRKTSTRSNENASQPFVCYTAVTFLSPFAPSTCICLYELLIINLYVYKCIWKASTCGCESPILIKSCACAHACAQLACICWFTCRMLYNNHPVLVLKHINRHTTTMLVTTFWL